MNCQNIQQPWDIDFILMTGISIIVNIILIIVIVRNKNDYNKKIDDQIKQNSKDVHDQIAADIQFQWLNKLLIATANITEKINRLSTYGHEYNTNYWESSIINLEEKLSHSKTETLSELNYIRLLLNDETHPELRGSINGLIETIKDNQIGTAMANFSNSIGPSLEGIIDFNFGE